VTAGRVCHPARNGPPGGASVRIVIARRSRQSGDNVGRGGLYRIADRARHDDAPLSKQLGVGAQNGRVIFPGLLFGILIASIYLPKSSMIAVGIVMVIALSVVSRNLRLTLFVAIPLLLAMLCWGARTAADGGRISFGTSLDGYNLHKGNNPTFLENYPPPFQFEYRSLLCRYWRRTSLQIRVGL
jgi:hypothetical protein